MRSIAVVWLLALLATASLACQEPRDTIDVLYVGNSYVYFNNLPELVEGISTGLDGPVLRGTAHTHGGATLGEHLEDDHLPEIFSEGPVRGDSWDWVLLHEQSTLGTSMDRESGALGGPDAYAAGSYLAACVIYATIAGKSPLGAPRELIGTPWSVAGPVESPHPTILVSLSGPDAAFLQGVAWRIVGPSVAAAAR